MHFLSIGDIPPPSQDETIFRVGFWGTFFAFLFMLAAALMGAGIFIYAYQHDSAWGLFISFFYTLMMFFICRAFFRTLLANRSSANWIARIGDRVMLLKYRSYLHTASPEEDPIALQLAWPEIENTRFQQRIYSSTDDEHKIKRWYLEIVLDKRYVDVDKVKSALAFEYQRRPAHFQVIALQHQLFAARKSKASKEQINQIKQAITDEKKRHPGKTIKSWSNDRPVVFESPCQLIIEWTHLSPGKKCLEQLLARYTQINTETKKLVNIKMPMIESELQEALIDLLNRNEKLQAIKLIRLQTGMGLKEAKAYVEHFSETL